MRFPLAAGLILLLVATPSPSAGYAVSTLLGSSIIRSAADPSIGWTRYWDTPVYAAPAATADLLTRLDRNQRVAVRGVRGGASGISWTHILLWNTFDGWIPSRFVAPAPVGSFPEGPATPYPRSLGPHGPSPVAGTGELDTPAYLRAAPNFGISHLRLLAAHTVFVVDSWAVDSSGGTWYHGAVSAGSPRGSGRVTNLRAAPATGWLWGDALIIRRAAPASPSASLLPFSGTGMWFTYRLLQVSSPAYIVRAAVQQGLSNLYVEVGSSRAGFYGAGGLAALLPVAHQAGLHVISWVYPYLADIPGDVAMTIAAARYRAPSGDRPDGVLADLEENMREADVRAYSQVTRALLGGNQPMGIATFPPQQGPGKSYPFRTVARSWDVIVPMDYWHLQHRRYTEAESYDFVARSITLIRAALGKPHQAVAPIGQAYNKWEDGVDSPSAAEIRGAMRAARDGGAIGVSFFEWNHATPEQWAAIGAGARAFGMPDGHALALSNAPPAPAGSERAR
jgi:hypothetical protein